jgi:anthranilate phosphoribosyltransferase
MDGAMTREPHPFTRFLKILGRGNTLTRSLTIEEAEEAMAMILKGETLPEQLGAFLMLLRVKEESPDEIAGFVRAARATLTLPANAPHVDVDWSSYAGERRQLPWSILSAVILARNGWRVFMRGAEGHTAGRVYASDALSALGLPAAEDIASAEAKARALWLARDRDRLAAAA